MQIHADLTKRAHVDTNELEWIPSPLKGVERLMLDRDGDEVARATSLVRYAPGSYFSPHTHSGGEEFLVLEGTFSDEMGDFPQGMYVRNPVGSKHKPHSEDGCVILVKLWQMPPDDQEFVRVDITKNKNWIQTPNGAFVLLLHETQYESVFILRLPEGYEQEARVCEGGIEYFILSGSFEDEDGWYTGGEWLRLPPGTKQSITSEDGATMFVKARHLEHDLPKPPVG